MERVGRRVWITGAGRGIGQALAQQLAAYKTDLILSARSINELGDTATRVRSQGSHASVTKLDVTDRDQQHQVIEQICIEGVPDLVILNAGTHEPIRAQSFDVASFEKLMRVNFFAMMDACSLLIPKMVEKGQGTIVLVGSLSSYRGLPTAAAYGASKAALINAAEALQAELYGSGVEIKVVNPGFVNTPLTAKNGFKMPAVVEPDAAAKAIIRGIRSKRFEIRFPRRFACLVSLLRWLPDSLYFPLIQKRTGIRVAAPKTTRTSSAKSNT